MPDHLILDLGSEREPLATRLGSPEALERFHALSTGATVRYVSRPLRAVLEVTKGRYVDASHAARVVASF